MEEEIEMQSKMYSRLAYQVIIPHIQAEKMSFQKWMDMWHPTEEPQQNKEEIIKQGRELWEKLESGELFDPQSLHQEEADHTMNFLEGVF